MEENIQNTIIIDDDKLKSKDEEENEDIFETIFGEIKNNFISLDGEEKEETQDDISSVEKDKKEVPEEKKE